MTHGFLWQVWIVGSGWSALCEQCGAPVAAAAAPTPVAMAPAGTSGLQENVAGLLCYLLGWLTGIIFLLIDKRPFVRFHAAQSIVVFGVLFIIRMILSFGILGTGLYGFGLWSMISLLVSLVTLVAWIVLMVMAYQGKMSKYRSPLRLPGTSPEAPRYSLVRPRSPKTRSMLWQPFAPGAARPSRPAYSPAPLAARRRRCLCGPARTDNRS